MKKLIVMALGVALAVGAQAAAVNWSVNGTPVGSGKTIYAFLQSDKSAIEALLVADQTGDAFTSGASSYVHSTATSSSRYAEGTLNDASLTAGNNYDVFFVIYTGGADPSYRVANSTVSSTAYDPTSPSTVYPEYAASSSTFGTTTKFSANPAPGPALPEPTSGILMLVGLGALALRRRRA